MATLPAVFFGAAGANWTEINYILKRMGPAAYEPLQDQGPMDTVPQVIQGTAASEIFRAGPGDTVQDGGLGFDILVSSQNVTALAAGFEALQLVGTATVGNGNAGHNIIMGNALNNKLDGKAGSDVIVAGRGKDIVFGGSGNDTLFGDAGNDKLYGGAGRDLLVGGSGRDRLDGGSGNDTLYGDSGNDTLFGMVGNDKLFGGSGNDKLFGGSGKDTLAGGTGTDSLFGGAGADRFLIERGDRGIDRIEDFKLADGDLVDLTAFNVTNLREQVTLTASGNDTLVKVSVPGQGTAAFKLIGYTPDQIDPTKFFLT